MYWIWRDTAGGEDEAIIFGVPPALRHLRELGVRFDYGASIHAEVPLIVIELSADFPEKLNDSLVAPGTTGLLFSPKLRAAFVSAGIDNIEYFPVRIVRPQDGTAVEDYQLVNIVGQIACVDVENSILEMNPDDPGEIEFIDSLVLDESRIRGALCFRLQEFLPIVVVHDRVKRACEAAGITGVKFIRPDAFSL